MSEVAFKKLGGNLVERARGNAGASYAELLGFGQNFLVFDPKFLCYVVNPNGHKYFPPPSWAAESS